MPRRGRRTTQSHLDWPTLVEHQGVRPRLLAAMLTTQVKDPLLGEGLARGLAAMGTDERIDPPLVFPAEADGPQKHRYETGDEWRHAEPVPSRPRGEKREQQEAGEYPGVVTE